MYIFSLLFPTPLRPSVRITGLPQSLVGSIWFYQSSETRPVFLRVVKHLVLSKQRIWLSVVVLGGFKEVGLVKMKMKMKMNRGMIGSQCLPYRH